MADHAAVGVTVALDEPPPAAKHQLLISSSTATSTPGSVQPVAPLPPAPLPQPPAATTNTTAAVAIELERSPHPPAEAVTDGAAYAVPASTPAESAAATGGSDGTALRLALERERDARFDAQYSLRDLIWRMLWPIVSVLCLVVCTIVLNVGNPLGRDGKTVATEWLNIFVWHPLQGLYGFAILPIGWITICSHFSRTFEANKPLHVRIVIVSTAGCVTASVLFGVILGLTIGQFQFGSLGYAVVQILGALSFLPLLPPDLVSSPDRRRAVAALILIALSYAPCLVFYNFFTGTGAGSTLQNVLVVLVQLAAGGFRLLVSWVGSTPVLRQCQPCLVWLTNVFFDTIAYGALFAARDRTFTFVLTACVQWTNVSLLFPFMLTETGFRMRLRVMGWIESALQSCCHTSSSAAAASEDDVKPIQRMHTISATSAAVLQRAATQLAESFETSLLAYRKQYVSAFAVVMGAHIFSPIMYLILSVPFRYGPSHRQYSAGYTQVPDYVYLSTVWFSITQFGIGLILFSVWRHVVRRWLQIDMFRVSYITLRNAPFVFGATTGTAAIMLTGLFFINQTYTGPDVS